MSILNNINSIISAITSYDEEKYDLSYEELINFNIGMKNCDPEIVNNKNIPCFYRGSSKKNYKVFILTPGKRYSADTNNVYNRVISEMLPSWATWPKRNKSIIMSTSYNHAKTYAESRKLRGKLSDIFVVIPQNNAKICIINHADLWLAFDYMIKETGCNLLNFTLHFKYLLLLYYTIDLQLARYPDEERFYDKTAIIKNYKYLVDTAALHTKIENQFNGPLTEIKRIFSFADNLYLDDKKVNLLEEVINELMIYDPKSFKKIVNIHRFIVSKRLNLTRALDTLLDPVNNEFKTETTTSVNFDNYHDNTKEAWCDSPCLFISRSYYTQFLEDYNKIISEFKENKK